MGSPSTRSSVRRDVENGDTPVFMYSNEEVASSLVRGLSPNSCNHDHPSKWDQMLFSRWDEAMQRGGVFRYSLDDVTTRVMDGRYGLVAQRNPKRFSHRRKPGDMQKLTQPFNPAQFNFNKIKKEEILLRIGKHQDAEVKGERPASGGPIQEEEDDLCPHLVVVNVSPIDYGHVLLVPHPQRCLPQVMTEDSIQLCLDIMALSNRSGFCMVANSLLAYASVNHLHYHFMCVAEPMLAARVAGAPLSGSCYELVDHPCRGFGFELTSTTAECARDIYRVVSLLLENDLPHNLVMIRAPPFSRGQQQQQLLQSTSAHAQTTTADDSDGATVIRTILVPRKPAYGLKNLFEGEGEVPPFFAAACELVLGLLPIVDQAKYPTLTEAEVLSIFNEKALSMEEFEPLKEKVKQILHF